MISRRTRRNSDAQERLRQFSLNNSKGINETAPITDNSTIQRAENLKLNPDGSLSLRDPLNVVTALNVGKPFKEIFPVFNDKYLIFFNDGDFGIFSKKGFINTTLKYFDYRGILHTNEYLQSINAPNRIFDVNNAQVITNATSVILGNCSVAVDLNLVDSTLYDAIIPLPRYLQFYFENDVLMLEIKSPEQNTITTAANGFSISTNTALDNPYSVRDEYSLHYADVKGIIPYAYTDSGLDSSYISSDFKEDLRIVDLTESVKDTRFRPVTLVGKSNLNGTLYLKAFGSFPKNPTETPPTYSWKASPTGVYTSVSDNSCTVTGMQVGDYTVSVNVGDVNSTCKVYVEPKVKELTISDVLINGKNENYWQPGDLLIPVKNLPETFHITFKVQCQFEGYSGQVSNLKNRLRLYKVPYDLDVISVTFTEEKNNTVSVDAEVKARYIAEVEVPGQSAKEYYYTFRGDISVRYIYQANHTLYSAQHPIQAGVISSLTEHTRYHDTSTSLDPKPQGHNSNALRLNSTRLYMLPNDSYTLTCTYLETYSGACAAWFKGSFNGQYTPIDLSDRFDSEDFVEVLEPAQYSGQGSDEDTGTSSKVKVNYVKIKNIFSNTEKISERIDVLEIPEGSLNASYKFRIITAKSSDEGSTLDIVLDEAIYNPVVAEDWEFAEFEEGNSSKGRKLLYKSSIYSYGDSSFNNTIFKSDAGSFITPYLNSIFADSIGSSKVTTIIPWRDYLYIATESAALLATPVENGFYTKIVNTFIGIPEEDSDCCKSALNGIVFKSGSKIFLGFPNLYSESDSTLNYTEISKPIEQILESTVYTTCYALTTSSEYMIFLLDDSDEDASTSVLVYNFNTKAWTVNTYKLLLKNAFNAADGTVHAFCASSKNPNVTFEVTLQGKAHPIYGFHSDLLYDPDNTPNATELSEYVQPIHFEWDTGQKTDSLINTHQFVESKFVFATLNEKDTFPFTTYVAIDGDPHVTKMDISTDAPFWKLSNDTSIGVAGTAFRLVDSASPVSDMFNTLRQLVIRYSGKGKSIRHLIEGDSLYNFKLYETYVRYKNLNIK